MAGNDEVEKDILGLMSVKIKAREKQKSQIKWRKLLLREERKVN